MTTDIKSLMTVAREYAATKDLLRGGAGAGTHYLRQLCDALEAMAGEVAGLKEAHAAELKDADGQASTPSAAARALAGRLFYVQLASSRREWVMKRS